MRECLDDNLKEVELRYNAGKMQDDNDIIILCKECSKKFPFDQEVISKIEIKKDEKFSAENSNKNNQPIKDGALN